MTNRSKSFLIGLLCCYSLFGTVMLIRGELLLLWPLPGGMPLGNLIAAATFMAVPALSSLLTNNRLVIRLSTITCILATLWLPISIWLAGNIHLNFSGDMGHHWQTATMVFGSWELMLIIAAWITGKIEKYKTRKA